MKTAAQTAAEKEELSYKGRVKKGDEELARKLRELRKEHGLSLRNVSAEIGISDQAILLTEGATTNPGLSTLAKLAAFYEVSLDELAGHMVSRELDEKPLRAAE